MKLLLLEDDLLVAQGVSFLLSLLGHQAEHAGSTAEAAVLLKEGSFGVIMADLCLGDESCISFLRWVRVRHPEIRRVLASGALGSPWLSEAQDGLIELFLQKPYARRELERVLRLGGGGTLFTREAVHGGQT
jgi:DNA-binding NtrC family response regulator